MKRLLAIGMIVLLAGCNKPEPDYRETKNGNNGNRDLTLFKVNDVILECVRAGHGLSCNWEKHNKLIEQKLTDSQNQ